MPDRRSALYLIAGGRGLDRPRGPDPLVQAVLRRTGVQRPKVAYVGAASGDNAAFRLLIGRILEKAGAGNVVLAPLCGRRAVLEKAMAVLESADIAFISGGDVEEGMRIVGQKGIIPFLKKLHRSGMPFFGVSAGSIMLARRWVRWTDPRNDDSAQLFSCLGFAPVLCDTHGEGESWAELRAALALSPVGATGYGIVSGSALVVEADGSIAALGGEVNVFRRRKSGVAQVASLTPSAAPRNTAVR
jgi:cyanophycinase-like exopeptidase